MNNARLPNSIFFCLAVLGAIHIYYRAPQLPPSLASHFGPGGQADGWQSQTVFLCIEIAMIVFSAIIAFGLPVVVAAVPTSMVNLPNRDYWLAADRREQTLNYFKVYAAWFVCGLLAFLLFVMDLVIRANFHHPPRLDAVPFATALILFLVFVAFWSIRLTMFFAKIPKANSQS
ncbi:MAG TPA: DUF1648 domain-containing protein [Candidatus Acidoferrum sp.]|jgi:uncharacterized membrane protein